MKVEKRRSASAAYRYLRALAVYAVSFSVFVIIETARNSSFGFRELSNVFTVSGAILFGIGSISYISSVGAYDIFTYAFSLYPFPRVFKSGVPEKYNSFYEYREEKNKKRCRRLGECLLIGAVSLLLGAVFAIA